MGYYDRDQNGPGGPGSGISGRLIGAAVIALIGLFLFLTQTQVNPVTGEKQRVAMSPAQEVRLGLESAPSMAQQMGGEMPASDPRTQKVKQIGQYLVSHTEASKSPWKFQFHLLADTKTVNAFALPGGQIFITRGLYDKLQTEAQLAGVLGHEMGHVIERHSAQQMAKSQLGQMLIAAVATGASSQDHPGSQYNAAVIASVVNHMFQLHYSRHDESEADTWGLKIMEEVNFDPRAMIEVMNILKAASGPGHQLAIFQTHPDPDLRIKQINEYLAEHPPSPNVTEGRSLKELSNLTN